jgi:hypothetical protein
MHVRFFPLLKLVAAITFALILIDAAVFRSGVYASWIEPDSTAGSVVSEITLIRQDTDAARRNVLVLGNSQIGEGFSWPTADAAVGKGDLHFVNGSVAGTTPRLWNYLLREVDPDANRYAAIVLMVDYDVTRWRSTFTDYPLDTSYAAPLLRISDLSDYPDSFADANLRERARRAILLPLQTMRLDLLDFIAHPFKRRNEIVHERPGWIAATAAYPGHKEGLPDLPIDASAGMPSQWGADESTLKPKLEPYFRGLRLTATAKMQAVNIRYQRQWVGRIAARYHAQGVPVIVFNIPRGPWHESLVPAPQPNSALVELSRSGVITILPGDAFVQFEKPQFFFDTLHMNHAGREAFSTLLAQKIAPLVR